MYEFDISKISSFNEKDLDDIEKKINENELHFITIKNAKNTLKLRETVRKIKKHFDIFILYKTEIPENFLDIDLYFSSEIHGIYFEKKEKLSNKNFEVLKYSAEIFPKGIVFYDFIGKNQKEIDELISFDIIPVILNCDENFINYTKERMKFKKHLTSYLKFFNFIEGSACKISFSERIRKKIILETHNLRQKLMTKDAEDSFNSSGL